MIKRRIVITISVVFVLITVTGFLWWNKPHRNIENANTEAIAAKTIALMFEENQELANKQFLNKALTVEGVVKDISVNENLQQVVLLDGNNELTGVQCVFVEKNDKIKEGDRVKISGFCNGFTLAVVLDDCKLLIKN